MGKRFLSVCLSTAAWALALVAVFPLANRAAENYPRILGSFCLDIPGSVVPKGVIGYAKGVLVIIQDRPSYNYLYRYDYAGSILTTYALAESGILGEADFAPWGMYGGHIGVIDEATGNLKAYTVTGSFLGIWGNTPTGARSYGGHFFKGFAYFGLPSGTVVVDDCTGSFLDSFQTGGAIYDLASSTLYDNHRGEYVIVGGDNGVYGVWTCLPPRLIDKFQLPLSRACGSSAYSDSGWFLRADAAGAVWAYYVELGFVFAVEPASLGRVKALFR